MFVTPDVAWSARDSSAWVYADDIVPVVVGVVVLVVKHLLTIKWL